MGVKPAIFESAGKRSEHLIPGSYSRSDSISGSNGGVSAGNAVILGRSAGGKPNTLLEFASLSEARDYLISGDLLDGIAHAFNPGGDYSPQKVFGMVVNSNTQAQRLLKSGSTHVLTVKTKNYGALMNQTKMRISAGTTGSKVQIKYKDKESQIDNIRRETFSLLYTGEGTSATVTVSPTGLVTEVQGVANNADNLSLSFVEFPTIEDLVSRINDTGVYTAVIIDTASGVKSSQLDTITGDIKAERVLSSNLQALIEALASLEYIGEVTLNSTESRILPEYDSDYVYFNGGTSGSYTVSDWVNALSVLETENVQIVSTPSTDEAVHALILNHCIAMSNVENRRERTCFLGGVINETLEVAIEKAKALSSKYASYCYPSIVAADPVTGETKSLPASYFSCKMAGLEAAIAVNEPLTWKDVKVVSWSKKLKNSEINKLIEAGVFVGAETDDGRLAVIRSLTTYPGNTLQDCERSMVREDLYMNRDLRTRYSAGIGKPESGGTAADLAVLNEAASEWYKAGLMPQPTVWGVSISKNGDKTYISFSRYLTAPKNFNFATASNFVYSSSGASVQV